MLESATPADLTPDRHRSRRPREMYADGTAPATRYAYDPAGADMRDGIEAPPEMRITGWSDFDPVPRVVDPRIGRSDRVIFLRHEAADGTTHRRLARWREL